MALSGNPARNFAAFPREIRDMVFTHVASAAGVKIDYYNTFNLCIDDVEPFTGCMIMLHEWATKSHVARAACEVLWAQGPFRCEWHSWSSLMIDASAHPELHLRCSTRKRSICLGAPIDPRRYIRDVELEVDLDLDDPSFPNHAHGQNLYMLGRELSKLHMLPRLRQVNIDIWIPVEDDAYHNGMGLVESLSSHCRVLRRQLGACFNITLIRDRDHDTGTKMMEQHNISWMWDWPNYIPRDSKTTELNDVEEHIKALLVDGTDSQDTLLGELRAAASKLPQRKTQIARMKDWSVGSGVGKEEWVWLKEHWGKENK